MTDPISTPSWAKSAGDVWVEAFEEIVGLRTSDQRLREELYPLDPTWRDQVADTHWCCALSWRRCARRLGVTKAPELSVPYEHRNGRAVSDVETICRRHGAWVASPSPGYLFRKGDVVIIGQNRPRRISTHTDEQHAAVIARWRAEWGGDEHVVGCVLSHEGDTVTAIEGGKSRGPGGKPAVDKCTHTLSIRNGRLWLDDRRIYGTGICEQIEIAPP